MITKLDPLLVKVISDVFKVPSSSVSSDMSSDNTERWDSLEHLNLILKVESAFQIKIPSQNIGKLRSAGKLQEEIDRQIHKANANTSAP